MFRTKRKPSSPDVRVSPDLRVIEHRPKVVFFWRLLLVLVCFALWAVGFFTGQWYLRSAPMELILNEREYLLEQIVSSRKRIVDLEVSLAQRQVEADIAQASTERMRTDYKKMFSSIDELNAQLTRYKKVLKPNAGEQGLVLGVLEVNSIDQNPQNREYNFSIDLFQPVDRLRLGGNISFLMTGIQESTSEESQDPVEKSYSFSEISLSGPLQTKLGFMHYQTIAGDIKLPEGFRPRSVQVVAQFDQGKQVTLNKNFPWASAGANDELTQPSATEAEDGNSAL